MDKLFVYGTLKESKLQIEIIGRECESSSAVIEGYVGEQISIEGKGYTIAIPKIGGIIEGKVLDVTEDELSILDKYETEVYDRIKTRLSNGEQVWVYIKHELTRAFIAIEFPDEVIKEVARVQEEVGKMKFQGKLTELENLHLTLKFLGEIDNNKLEEIKKRLKTIKFKEMELKLGVAGTFGFRGNPKIVWIKVNGEEIWELQKKIDSALSGLFEKEERFMSHLTIARLKYAENSEEFIRRVKKLGVREIKFKIKEFKLKKSELRPLGPVYSDIEVYGSE